MAGLNTLYTHIIRLENTMLKTLLVALMLGAGPNGERDLYIFTEPEFNSIEACQVWANENPETIIYNVTKNYGDRPIEMVYCIPERSMPKYLPKGEAIQI